MSAVDGGMNHQGTKWGILYSGKQEALPAPSIYPSLSRQNEDEDLGSEEQLSDGELVEVPPQEEMSIQDWQISSWSPLESIDLSGVLSGSTQNYFGNTPKCDPALTIFLEFIESPHQPSENPYYRLCNTVLEGTEKKPLSERIDSCGQVASALEDRLGEKALSLLRQTFYHTLIQQEAALYQADFDKGGHPRAYLEKFREREEQLVAWAEGSCATSASHELIAYALCEKRDDLDNPLSHCTGPAILNSMNRLYEARKKVEERGSEGVPAFLLELKQRWQRLAGAYCVLGEHPLLIEGVERGEPKPFELLIKREPIQKALCVNYIDLILKGKERSALSWFTTLSKGIQYRLYHNICDKKIGESEKRLLTLHNQNALLLYQSMFPRDRVTQEELTPEFIRSQLFTLYVQKRLASYPKEDQEILKAIEFLTMVYHVSDKPEVWVSHMRKIKTEIYKFLEEDCCFLSYIHQQAIAARGAAPRCGSLEQEALSWSKEHFLDDPHIFYQALTRWYDVLPESNTKQSCKYK